MLCASDKVDACPSFSYQFEDQIFLNEVDREEQKLVNILMWLVLL
jgi:hypothetical protein